GWSAPSAGAARDRSARTTWERPWAAPCCGWRSTCRRRWRPGRRAVAPSSTERRSALLAVEALDAGPHLVQTLGGETVNEAGPLVELGRFLDAHLSGRDPAREVLEHLHQLLVGEGIEPLGARQRTSLPVVTLAWTRPSATSRSSSSPSSTWAGLRTTPPSAVRTMA